MEEYIRDIWKPKQRQRTIKKCIKLKYKFNEWKQ